MNSIKELSNMSYTNKDFNSIYVELLEYAKKLSYRWDPTASDESDPGVVLLKLAAIIGDKDNYNIDKNILELMPISVTQRAAACQLFDQCGYSMHHYVAAKGYVNVKLTQDISPSLKELSAEDALRYTYDIPMFTMFTDVDQSVVYTTTAPIKTLNVNIPQSVEVIEGTITHYSVNNDTTITLNNLDSRNRIYLTDYNIAENGIFIKNIGADNYEEWQKVDNLETQPVRTPCYRFGLLNDQSVCYIEFPDDAEFLFSQGINISYIKTSGSVGTVGKGRLSRLFVDTNIVEHFPGSEAVQISVKTDSTGFYINNDTPITNGKDPESIDDAYKSYKRVKDTFDTLVSLKDYSDYLVTSEGASNGYVCDRNNDVQHSYKLLESNTATNVLRTLIEDAYKEKTVYNTASNKEEKLMIREPAMLPFDLCVYALQPVHNIKDWNAFNKSFELLSKSEYEKIFTDELNTGYHIKSLQHNFLDFDPEKILMIRNKYILPCTVLPRHKIAPSERFSIQSNLEDALFKALNSKNMTFGQRIDPVEIKNTMLNADARIKDIENNFSMTTYETYAVYLNKEGKFCELRIDDESPIPDQELIPLWDKFRSEIFAKNVLAGASSLYSPDTPFVYSVNQKDTKIYNNITHFTTNAIIPLNIRETVNNNSIYATRELADAESILLTSPSYIEDNNYSTYTKVVYSISSDINAESKYTLKGDDFIVFFWKTASTDTDYTYMKYSAKTLANVIKPTFNLSRIATWVKNLGQNGTNIVNYFRNLKDGSGRTSSTRVVIEDKSETTFVSELTSERSGEVLVGNSVITTLKKNVVHVNQPTDQGASNIYWILNETVKNSHGDDVYRLFGEGSANEEQTYTLQSGEYFVYTNNIKGALYIQGEGTVIKRRGFTGPGSVWEVEPCAIEEIDAEGPAALINRWYKIPLDNSQKLEVQEMQRIVIGPGTQLIAEYNGSNSVDDIVLSSEPKNLKNYKLSYFDNFGITQLIDDISEGWDVSTLLNLSITATEPQNLIAGHSVTFTYIEDEEEKQVEISVSTDNPLEVKSIFGNVSYTHVGGNNVPVILPDESELNIMTYVALNSTDNSIRYSNTEFTCEVRPTPESSTIDLPEFTLLKGEYLINISYSVMPQDNKQFNLSKVTILNNTNNNISEFLKDSNIFILTVNSDTKIELRLEFDNVKSADDLATIKPIVRFSREKLNRIPVGSDKTTFEDLLKNQFAELDINRRCDYTSFDAEIDNPLNSASFFDSAHVYNPYTICQWTRSSKNGDIKVKLNVV